jgi:hypothetical protein
MIMTPLAELQKRHPRVASSLGCALLVGYPRPVIEAAAEELLRSRAKRIPRKRVHDVVAKLTEAARG